MAVDSNDPLGVLGGSAGADASDPLGVTKKAPASSSLAPTPQAGSPPSGTQEAAAQYHLPGKQGTSALEAFSDALDVPLDLGSAFLESPGVPWSAEDWKKTGSDVSRAWGILRSKGPKALGEEYFPTSQAALERKAPNDPFSGAALKYPAVRALGAIASEGLNPSNVLLPAAAGLAGKGVVGAAKLAGKIPGVAKAATAVADKVGPEFDRFYGVRKAGGVEGDTAMRNMVSKAAVASERGTNKGIDLMRPEAGTALSPQEKWEVGRRSQGLRPEHVVNKNIPIKLPRVPRRFKLPNANPNEDTALGYLRGAGYTQNEAEQLVNDAARVSRPGAAAARTEVRPLGQDVMSDPAFSHYGSLDAYKQAFRESNGYEPTHVIWKGGKPFSVGSHEDAMRHFNPDAQTRGIQDEFGKMAPDIFASGDRPSPSVLDYMRRLGMDMRPKAVSPHDVLEDQLAGRTPAAASPSSSHFGATISRAANERLQSTLASRTAAAKRAIMDKTELARDEALTQRGKDVRAALIATDSAQHAAHPDLLPPGSTFDPNTFVPMSGQYAKQGVTDEVAQFLDEQRPAGAGGLRTGLGTASPRAPGKVYANFDKIRAAEAQRAARGEDPLLKPDFDLAQSLGHHFAQRGRNVAIEQAIQKMPKSLAARIEYERPSGSGQALMPKHLAIEDYAHWGNQAEEQFAKATKGMRPITPPGHVPADEVVKLLGSSPSAAQRTFHPEAIKLMVEAGASHEEAGGVAAFFGMLNKLQRIGVIINPVVHVGWNLLGNYLGAKGDPAKLTYIATGKGFDHAGTLDKLAEENGAHAHMGIHSMLGGDPARLLTSSGGNPIERLDRAMTRGWNANQHLVFGIMERRFSNALFADKVQALQAQGMSLKDAAMHAGIEVRKTFGDYANINQAKGSLESILSKGFYFYNWMKTIIPFVTKTAVNNPSWITKPVRGIQAWNQGMGDPNAATKSTVPYLGTWKGQPHYLSLPFPQRNLEEVLDMGRTGGGLGPNLTAILNMAASHANLPTSLVIDAAATTYGSPKTPGGLNIHTLFDKAAPGDVQGKQVMSSVGERLVPPMLRNIPALAKGDYSPLFGAMGGVTYGRPGLVQQKMIDALRYGTPKTMGLLGAQHEARKIGDKKLADDFYRMFTKISQGMGLP